MFIDEFKEAVASFVGRPPSYFQYNEDGSAGPDKLLIAINNAKMFLQRQVDFEYARTAVDLLCDPVRGVMFDYGTDILSGERIAIKKIDDVYFKARYRAMRPLRQMSRRAMVAQVRKGMNTDQHDWTRAVAPRADEFQAHHALYGVTWRDPVAWQHGRRLYIYPSPGLADWQNFQEWYPQSWLNNYPTIQPCGTLPDGKFPPVPLSCDVIELLPPYGNIDGPVDKNRNVVWTHDFILDFCYDYMLFRSLSELNVFLKDTEQVTLSQSKMSEALQNIREWNADLINADFNLE